MAIILILSEDLEDRLLYEHVLKQHGYNYVSVSSRQDTLSNLESSEIDVLFIVGPRRLSFDGWEFYGELKSNPELCDIPVIVYAPWVPSSITPRPSDYGDTLFTMPMDIRQFVKKVEELTSIDQE